MARTISLRVHQFRGEAALVFDQANTAIALCEEHEFVHYLALALILRGWARALQGEFYNGIEEMQEGLDQARGAGALLFESYALGLKADACIKYEHYEQAFIFLGQAQLRLDRENSERFYMAEIYRLFGEAYLRSGRDLDQAELYLRKGVSVARDQKSRWLELRLCLSLDDLYKMRPSMDKHRSQLGEIYGSFTEGFDTIDLIKAKARLPNA
jgi:predicted ATPase